MRRRQRGGRGIAARSLAVLLACLPVLAVAAELPPRLLLVISKTEQALQLRDPDSFAFLASAPLGPDPHEIAVSPDGRTAYVSNPGNGAFHRIDVIDLQTGRAKAPIDTAPLFGPHGLAFVQDRLWFTAQGSKAIGHLDPQARAIDWIMGTGQDSRTLVKRLHTGRGAGIYMDASGNRAFVSCTPDGFVAVIDLDTLRETARIEVERPDGVALSMQASAPLDWQQRRERSMRAPVGARRLSPSWAVRHK